MDNYGLIRIFVFHYISPICPLLDGILLYHHQAAPLCHTGEQKEIIVLMYSTVLSQPPSMGKKVCWTHTARVQLYLLVPNNELG